MTEKSMYVVLQAVDFQHLSGTTILLGWNY